MDANQNKAYDALVNIGAERAVIAFLNYHGTQLIDDGFIEFLVSEGIADASDFPDIFPDEDEDEEDIEDDFADGEGGDE